MARFNRPVTTVTKTRNFAGGEAFIESPELELASLLLTSFVTETFYEKTQARLDRLDALIAANDPLYCAKAAIFARTQFHMRSISHVIAARLAGRLKGSAARTGRARAFYNAIVVRPDDMTEILSLVGAKEMTPAMRRGFADAFWKFDSYQLAKYRGEGKAISLVDVVNLVHPIPSDINRSALRDLVAGTLRSRDTWESKLTQAGQEASDASDKAERKAEAWSELLAEGRLGYLAALRNIRNIMEQAPGQIDALCDLLRDEKRIRNSRVLPFRYMTALDALSGIPVDLRVAEAISDAVEIAVSNCPVLPGRTLIALDESGSMQGKPMMIGSLFAAVLKKRCENADLMTFDSEVRWRGELLPGNPVLTTASILASTAHARGTNFRAIFETLTAADQRGVNVMYDRIVILSDMQAWMGYYAPTDSFARYRQTGANPHIFSFDLQGYGTLQFPERQVYCLAGFSEKVFDIMSALEEDRNALVNRIKAVEL